MGECECCTQAEWKPSLRGSHYTNTKQISGSGYLVIWCIYFVFSSAANFLLSVESYKYGDYDSIINEFAEDLGDLGS